MNKNIEVLRKSISSIDIIDDVKIMDFDKDKHIEGIRGFFKAFDMTYTYCFAIFEEHTIIGLNLNFNFKIKQVKKLRAEKALQITNKINDELVGLKSVFLESTKNDLKIQFSHEVFIPNEGIDENTLSKIIEQSILSVAAGPTIYSQFLSKHKIDHNKLC